MRKDGPRLKCRERRSSYDKELRHKHWLTLAQPYRSQNAYSLPRITGVRSHQYRDNSEDRRITRTSIALNRVFGTYFSTVTSWLLAANPASAFMLSRSRASGIDGCRCYCDEAENR